MFIYRLENEEGVGPFSRTFGSSNYWSRDVREMLIEHLVPEEQGLSPDELRRIKDDLIHGKEYHFAWSTADLICEYIKPEYRNYVEETGYIVAIYRVPDEHCYILPKDRQVIFDRKHQTKIASVSYRDFLNMNNIGREVLLK